MVITVVNDPRGASMSAGAILYEGGLPYVAEHQVSGSGIKFIEGNRGSEYFHETVQTFEVRPASAEDILAAWRQQGGHNSPIYKEGSAQELGLKLTGRRLEGSGECLTSHYHMGRRQLIAHPNVQEALKSTREEVTCLIIWKRGEETIYERLYWRKSDF